MSKPLRDYVERLEDVEQKIRELNDEKRRIYAEANADGHDKARLGMFVRDLRQLRDGNRVYFVEFPQRGLIKVGVSKQPTRRMYALKADAGEPGTLIATVPGTYPIEAWCHARMSPWKVDTEWYERNDASLSAVQDLVQQISETHKTPPSELLIRLYDEAISCRTGRAFQGTPEVFPSLSSGNSDGAVERRAPAPSAFYTERGFE